ncbi:MAG: NADH:ubiquinone reductase (Na(+)-transporting) subunit C [Candidatus Omnitrophica bacterium]|nr:NADH:ubiquinone reductase (Na(+)-transporting) subunit C [Candidatus Omnitrophota bacterium]
MQDSLLKNPFVFATLICVVCSAALSLCASGLRPIQERNQQIYQHRNILLAVGIPSDPDTEDISAEQVEQIFEEKMKKVTIDADGNPVEAPADASADSESENPDVYQLYEFQEDGEVKAYVLPMTGQGLWGPISGYLALEPDCNTIKGVTFFTKMETPGLGAEISNPPFESQFPGKHVFDKDGNLVSINVVKGKAEEVAPKQIDHSVDGVSGATITSNGVQAMLLDWLTRYEPYFKKVKEQHRKEAA